MVTRNGRCRVDGQPDGAPIAAKALSFGSSPMTCGSARRKRSLARVGVLFDRLKLRAPTLIGLDRLRQLAAMVSNFNFQQYFAVPELEVEYALCLEPPDKLAIRRPRELLRRQLLRMESSCRFLLLLCGS